MARAPTAIDQDEAPPEFDRLGAFPHPRETTLFFGNAQAEQTLLDAVTGGRMHHAWLLAGPEGVGKATLAYRLARFLFHHGGGDGADAQDLSVPVDSPAYRQVAALSHPNLLVLRRPWQERNGRFAASITIDEVRRLRAFLGSTAGAGGRRVVIVDRAEDMNVNAANALLKSLEEPPAGTVFLLVSSAPGRLAATVRSRCRTLALQALERDDLAAAVGAALEAVGEEAPSGSKLDDVARLAQGSVRHALQLLSGGGIALYGKLAAALKDLPRLDYGAVHALADGVAGRDAEPDFEMLFALLEDSLARMVHQAATGAGAEGQEAELAERLIPPHGLARWAELWEEVRRAKADALALNLDRKSLVLGTFFRIEETARSLAR